MTMKRSRPAPETIRLKMKETSRDIVDDFRHGKPNRALVIERALVNAWKAGRDAVEAGDADAAMEPESTPVAVPAAKLGRKTEAVLRDFGYVAYGPDDRQNRESHLFWRSQQEPFTGRKSWYLVALDGEGVAIDDVRGDASMQACVKLGLFAPGSLKDKDGEGLPDEILVATSTTRLTFLQIVGR